MTTLGLNYQYTLPEQSDVHGMLKRREANPELDLISKAGMPDFDGETKITVEGLMESIDQEGLFDPITLRYNPDRQADPAVYLIIDGWHRFMAFTRLLSKAEMARREAKESGDEALIKRAQENASRFNRIPAFVMPDTISETYIKLIALDKNVQRKLLTPDQRTAYLLEREALIDECAFKGFELHPLPPPSRKKQATAPDGKGRPDTGTWLHEFAVSIGQAKPSGYAKNTLLKLLADFGETKGMPKLTMGTTPDDLKEEARGWIRHQLSLKGRVAEGMADPGETAAQLEAKLKAERERTEVLERELGDIADLLDSYPVEMVQQAVKKWWGRRDHATKLKDGKGKVTFHGSPAPDGAVES